jgi:hypothetical protein
LPPKDIRRDEFVQTVVQTFWHRRSFPVLCSPRPDRLLVRSLGPICWVTLDRSKRNLPLSQSQQRLVATVGWARWKPPVTVRFDPRACIHRTSIECRYVEPAFGPASEKHHFCQDW